MSSGKKEKGEKGKKTFHANVGIRGPTFVSSGGFETESKETLKNIEIESEISLEDTRNALIQAYAKLPDVHIDERGGKLFVATTSASVKMVEVKNNLQLSAVLIKGKSGSIIHLSLGALDSEDEDEEPFVLSQGSHGALKNLRNPPAKPLTKSVKAAATANTANALAIKSFVEDLYHKPESPFYHGFFAYHQQLIIANIKERQQRKEDTHMTDTANGKFPAAEDWNLFDLEQNWSTQTHLEACHHLSMERGKYPPVNGYTIPNAFECFERLTKEEKKARKEKNTGTSATTSVSQPISKIAQEMEEANKLLRIKLGVVQPAEGPAKEASKIERVKRGIDELYRSRKQAVDSGFTVDSDNVVNIDKQLSKYAKRYSELKEMEDADLF